MALFPEGLLLRRRVAFHEAGHAAMALILGDKLHRVTIKPKGQMQGMTFVSPRSPSGHILTAVAGTCAEAIRFRERYAMNAYDMREATALVTREGDDTRPMRTKERCGRSRENGHALAFALEEHETLRGKEAWGVFVRGLAPHRKMRKKARR